MMPLSLNATRFLASRNYEAVIQPDGSYIVGGPAAACEALRAARGEVPAPDEPAWLGGAVFSDATKWPEVT